MSGHISPPLPHYILTSQLNNVHFEPGDILPILLSLPLGKAVGPDLINYRILKEAAPSIAFPLSLIFNKSVSDSWKMANVCPILKRQSVLSFEL